VVALTSIIPLPATPTDVHGRKKRGIHYQMHRTGTNMPMTAQSRRIGISLRLSSNMQYSYVLYYNKVRWLTATATAKAKQQQNCAHFHRRCRITCPNVSRYVNPFSPLLLLLVGTITTIKIESHTYRKFKEGLLHFHRQRRRKLKPTGTRSGSLMGIYPVYPHCSKHHKQGSKV
jgi:hypothetical protein